MELTIMNLQKILGDCITNINSTQDSPRKHEEALKDAEYIAKISKQLINAADVVLRTDKLCGTKERINKYVGE